MKYGAALAVGVSVIAGTSAFSYAACTKRVDQEVLNQLTATANNGCLATGGDYRIEADVDGKISFVSTKVGSLDGKLTVDVVGQPNASLLVDDKMKLIFNESKQNCLKPFTQQTIDYILTVSKEAGESRTNQLPIYGEPATSHAGDNPADGPDVTSCARADVANGWSLRPSSGAPETMSVSNGDMGLVRAWETADSYCVTFHMRRADQGRSATIVGRAVATEQKSICAE